MLLGMLLFFDAVVIHTLEQQHPSRVVGLDDGAFREQQLTFRTKDRKRQRTADDDFLLAHGVRQSMGCACLLYTSRCV